MTSLEMFQALRQAKPTPRLLFDLPVTPPVAESLKHHFNTDDLVAATGGDFYSFSARYPVEPLQWRKAYEAIGFPVPERAEISPLGFVHLAPGDGSTGKAWHLTRMLHPLAEVQSTAELESLPWPDLKDSTPFSHVAQEVAKTHQKGKVAVGHMSCTVFEHSWYLRGMENLFYDWFEEGQVGEWLMDWFMERSKESARQFVRSGVDILWLGDDIASQQSMLLSMDLWRRHIKPRLAAVIAAARAEAVRPVTIAYHSDGNITPAIPELLEVGVDILNPLQPECLDASRVIETYRTRAMFWGMVGTQTTLPFGSRADIARVVKNLQDLAAAGAGIVAAPTHVVEPDVPLENIVALIEEVHRPISL